jgi:hypothetical protein
LSCQGATFDTAIGCWFQQLSPKLQKSSISDSGNIQMRASWSAGVLDVWFSLGLYRTMKGTTMLRLLSKLVVSLVWLILFVVLYVHMWDNPGKESPPVAPLWGRKALCCRAFRMVLWLHDKATEHSWPLVTFRRVLLAIE